MCVYVCVCVCVRARAQACVYVCMCMLFVYVCVRARALGLCVYVHAQLGSPCSQAYAVAWKHIQCAHLRTQAVPSATFGLQLGII